MGIEETDDNLIDKPNGWVKQMITFVAKRLLRQEIILKFIALAMIWVGYRQYMNAGKVDAIKDKQEVVATKQEKIDSTSTIQVKYSQKRDSVNKVFKAELDTIKNNQLLILKHFKIKS